MKIFKSKFGFETLALELLILVVTLLFMQYQNQPMAAMLVVSGIFLLVFAVCVYLNFSTTYTLYDTGTLKIKSGIFYSKEFDIQNIKSIAKSSSLVSSPAPSLDRIEMTYGTCDDIIISPKYKTEFAQALLKINPNIINRLPK